MTSVAQWRRGVPRNKGASTTDSRTQKLTRSQAASTTASTVHTTHRGSCHRAGCMQLVVLAVVVMKRLVGGRVTLFLSSFMHFCQHSSTHHSQGVFLFVHLAVVDAFFFCSSAVVHGTGLHLDTSQVTRKRSDPLLRE